jgi:hypothetical protein
MANLSAYLLIYDERDYNEYILDKREIAEQRKVAINIIRAGKENGADEIEITMSQKAGVYCWCFRYNEAKDKIQVVGDGKTLLSWHGRAERQTPNRS